MQSKYYIPIIGEISSGKSTFLNSFLGINFLQTGMTTTTTFICLIKNSNKSCFYHVIPKTQNGLTFVKEGEEIRDEQKIKKKIKDINETLDRTKGTKNELFYMLETPIKNINNQTLLDKCYFMDIPGLNACGEDYIEDIFSLININDILFEIMIFDSTSIGSEAILRICKKINDKNCLKKEKNLYILNKIDRCSLEGENEIIDIFKKYIYDNFENEKEINKDAKVIININRNYLIPLNSLLYQAESNFGKDFYSLLLIELFSYIKDDYTSKFSSFLEFLEKRIECIISQNNININKIENQLDNLNDNDIDLIKASVEKIEENKYKIIAKSQFNIEINLKKSKIKNTLKKLYLIHKLKIYTNFSYSKSYLDLQNIINNFDKNDLPTSLITPPSNIDKSVLDRFNFIEDKLKNYFPESYSQIQELKEYINRRKIRIVFTGNLSAGKSTVLNSIIGEDILPINESVCNFIGIIIKHNKDLDNFYLYRTKVEISGRGSNEYFNFEEEKEPYCKGIENIKSYIKNKNSDNHIEDRDVFIVIKGRLKIFDFISLDEELIKKIEFIELPGYSSNSFALKRNYEKVLKYSNSCIYINEPISIEDIDSRTEIKIQYLKYKDYLCYYLRSKFINSCLFLINKSDYIQNKNDREKIKNNLVKTISEVEGNVSMDNIHISFFSGKYFIEYLKYYKLYVELVEKNPFLFLKYLYNEWSSDKWCLRNFKNYLVNEIAYKIKEIFDLELDKDNFEQVPQKFYDNLKSAFNKLYDIKYRGITQKEEDEMIKKLYTIYISLKNKDFSNTKYSTEFFKTLREVIIFSNNVAKENINKKVETFLSIVENMLTQLDLK